MYCHPTQYTYVPQYFHPTAGVHPVNGSTIINSLDGIHGPPNYNLPQGPAQFKHPLVTTPFNPIRGPGYINHPIAVPNPQGGQQGAGFGSHQSSRQGVGVFPVQGGIGSLLWQSVIYCGNSNRTYGHQANLRRPTKSQASNYQAEEAMHLAGLPKGNERRRILDARFLWRTYSDGER